MGHESEHSTESQMTTENRYPEFARLFRLMTGDVTSRQAAIRTGISHQHIAMCWKGQRRLSYSKILEVAEVYKTDPAPLLKAAGYKAEANSAATSGAKSTQAALGNETVVSENGQLKPEAVAFRDRITERILELPPEDWENAFAVLDATVKAQLEAKQSEPQK